jgi:hypothetical protein
MLAATPMLATEQIFAVNKTYAAAISDWLNSNNWSHRHPRCRHQQLNRRR